MAEIPEAATSQQASIRWDPTSSEDLDDWLKIHKPSKTADSADGWIWVEGPRAREFASHKNFDSAESARVLRLARESIAETVKEQERIRNDDSIPVRASKQRGRSKKQHRDEVEDRLSTRLMELGSGSPMWRTGKWMLFEKTEYVDGVFAKLAKSIVSGPLSQLEGPTVGTIKASTSGNALDHEKSSSHRGDDDERRFLICVYFESTWNSAHARLVLETIAREHGVIPSSCKADLYTLAGIYSKHPCGLRSTVFSSNDFISKAQQTILRRDYNVRMKRQIEATAGAEPSDDEFVDNAAKAAPSSSATTAGTSAAHGSATLANQSRTDMTSPAPAPAKAAADDVEGDKVPQMPARNDKQNNQTIWSDKRDPSPLVMVARQANDGAEPLTPPGPAPKDAVHSDKVGMQEGTPPPDTKTPEPTKRAQSLGSPLEATASAKAQTEAEDSDSSDEEVVLNLHPTRPRHSSDAALGGKSNGGLATRVANTERKVDGPGEKGAEELSASATSEEGAETTTVAQTEPALGASASTAGLVAGAAASDAELTSKRSPPASSEAGVDVPKSVLEKRSADATDELAAGAEAGGASKKTRSSSDDVDVGAVQREAAKEA